MSTDKYDEKFDDQYADESYTDEASYETAYEDTMDAEIEDDTSLGANIPNEEDSDWGEESDIAEDSAPPMEDSKNKKFSLSKIAIVAAVVIFGGIVLSMIQNSGQSELPTDLSNVPVVPASGETALSPQDIAPTENSSSQLNALRGNFGESSEEGMMTAPTPSMAEAGQGLMEDTTLLNKMENPLAEESAQKVAPTPSAPQEEPIIRTNIEGQSVGTGSTTVDLQPIGDVTSIEAIDSTPSSVSETLDQIKDATTASITPVSDFPTVEMIKKPDELKKSGTQAPLVEKDVVSAQKDKGALSLAVEKNPSVAPLEKTAEAKLKEAEEKIIALQKKLDESQAELKRSPESVNKDDTSSLKIKIADLEEQLKQKSPSSDVRVVDSKPAASKTIEKPAVKSKKSLSKPDQTAKDWILKSARTGHAIIVSKRTGDYKTVGIGETVSSIGRVTNIKQTHSGWEVQGTKGIIRE